jgi:hypothetical protein
MKHGTLHAHNNKGCRCAKCRAVWNEYQQEYRDRPGKKEERARHDFNRRQKIADLKAELKSGGCVLCGYNAHPAALHFHHTDGEEKEREVCEINSPKCIREEAAKCVVLCANCHAIVHATIPDA